MNENIKFFAGNNQNKFEAAFNNLKENKITERIWAKDYTVWSNSPDEITNSLGWLYSPENSLNAMDSIYEFVNSLRKEGFKQALLLGMGGSSLTPRVFREVFSVKNGYLDMDVLDSTHPDAVLECSRKFDPAKTLYIVSTKSGGTVETLSFMKYFFNQTANKLGQEKAAGHFIAITDPRSGLEKTAKEYNFRKIFLNNPNIGGRYSALSNFGIVPAALIGVDIGELLKRAIVIEQDIKSAKDNSSAAKLGVFIGALVRIGKDKVTFILSETISHFGVWIEQLIAESTGKSGKGILPVVDESVEPPGYYANDRLFVYIRTPGDNTLDKKVTELKNAGHPFVEVILKDIYDLGGEFFRWEMATAIAGWFIGIHPFNQPNVESAKVLARKMVEEYSENGRLPELKIALQEKDIKVYASAEWKNITQGLKEFLSGLSQGEPNGSERGYISLQAYLRPDEETSKVMQELRTHIQQKYRCATTFAYGPGFLHSTGQLHKGDAGKGLFIQFMSQCIEDTPIPDEMTGRKSSITFGTLIKAQALGDRKALMDSGRKVITIDLGNDISSSLKRLNKSI